MTRIANVSPEEWKRMLRRYDDLKGRAVYDVEAAAELKDLGARIRALGNLPADGS